MYLVLTAMLALNVSADIINGFTKLRHSMESSMNSTNLRTDEVMTIFERAYSKDAAGEAKYGEWWAVAKAMQEKSDEFYNYIEGFKLEITNRVEGKQYTEMPKAIKNGTDTHKAHRYALNELTADGKTHGEELEERMDEFCRFITEAESPCIVRKMSDPKFAKAWRQKQTMFHDLFDTNEVVNAEGVPQPWARSVFNEMPAAAVLAVLTKYQNDVRLAENDLVNFFYQAAGSSDFVFNHVDALILPAFGEYVMAGQHYGARIVAAAIDTNQVPRVFINGEEIFGGYYEVLAGKPGPQEYSGYMLIGDDTTHYEFTGRYTVGEPTATVAHTELNILYRGYDNPFSISVPGVSPDKISVNCAGAKVSKDAKGMWIIVPAKDSKDETHIEVSAIVEGKNLTVAKVKYRVKDLPNPNVYIAFGDELKDETITRKELLDPKVRIVASYGQDGLVQAKFTIKSFVVKTPTGATINVKGDKLDAKAIAQLNKVAKNSEVKIQYIKAARPDGSEATLRSVSYTIK